jgi:hypothetical protein
VWAEDCACADLEFPPAQAPAELFLRRRRHDAEVRAERPTASALVNEAVAPGRSLQEVAREAGGEEHVPDEALDYHGMAGPHER